MMVSIWTVDMRLDGEQIPGQSRNEADVVNPRSLYSRSTLGFTPALAFREPNGISVRLSALAARGEGGHLGQKWFDSSLLPVVVMLFVPLFVV